MMRDYLLTNSGIAKILAENSDEPITLEALLMTYCETSERFIHVIELLEKLLHFEIEPIKTSNCMIDGTLPYDSLIGLCRADLETLYELIDYLDLPRTLHEKFEKVIQKDVNWGPYTIKEFVQNGDLRGMKYLYEEKDEPFDKDTCKIAATYGHLECLKYAHTQGCPWDKWTCTNAAGNGQLECLKYAHTQGCPWVVETCANAAYNGHLDCLQYAHTQGCPWDGLTCGYAAANGNLECLKYAHAPDGDPSRGCPWDEKTCILAALHGHLQCLKYAHAPPVGERCPWSELACAHAARMGRLNCLKYLHEQGCPWDNKTRIWAIMHKQIECLNYAIIHDCPQ